MNKTKIEYVDYTWNPMTGCNHGCQYCYARRIAERFKGTKAFPNGFTPTFHKNRLEQPRKIKKQSKIFVCSMADLLGDWVKDREICEVLHECFQSKHTFLFLTKNPKRYKEFWFPENCWLGYSVSNQKQYNFTKMTYRHIGNKNIKFLSLEPLREEILLNWMLHDWVIVGAETGNSKNRITPKKEWIDKLIVEAKRNKIPLFLKDNLGYHKKIQEFPE